MRPTLSLIRREFSAYFVSPIAYVVLVIFLAGTGYLFTVSLGMLTDSGPHGTSEPMKEIVGNVVFWLIFMFIPPLLTMRLLAEERGSGTLEMLLTAPIRDWQVVAAKFLACYGFYLVLWLPTLLYLPVLTDWNWWTLHCNIDPYPIATTYLGLALAGAMFIAIGLFVSSLVNSQMIAAIVSLAIGVLFVAGMWLPEWNTSKLPYQILTFFTVPRHFERDFSRGLIDTRHLILYASVTLFCLFLTVRSLEKRR